MIAFYPTDDIEIYQLIFGDLQSDGKINIISKSNNRDMALVLTTVIQTIHLFFERFPSKTVIFTGSTVVRTRLYRAAISKMLNEISDYYEIIGFTEDGNIEQFVSNTAYYAYSIKRKYANSI